MAFRKKFKKPRPSKNFAYFLGALAGDGYVSKKALILSVTQKDFALHFKDVGQSLFDMEASFYHRKSDNPNHSDVYSVTFFSRDLAQWIGNFKGGSWHKTIEEKYSWILEKDYYKVSFFNGYFDSEGSVENMKKSKKTAYMRCRISIGY